jgi:hypothetical protein
VIAAPGIATRQQLEVKPLAQEVVSALVSDYKFALTDPVHAPRDLETLVPGLDPTLVAVQLHALLPAFRAADGRVGELDPAVLAWCAQWETRFGIVSRRPGISDAFDPSFAHAANSAAG